MNELKDLVIMRNGEAVTDSLKVAETFGKQHRNVLQGIRNLTAENSAVKNMFVESDYVNKRGQEYPIIYMNRDGFTLIVMGFTGKKAMEFKLKYIAAFNKMEAYIREQEAAKQLPKTPEELLQLTMKATNHLDERVTNVEEDIDYLKNKSEVDENQRYKLQKARNKRCIEVCGGKESNFYKTKSRKVFMALAHDFKEFFQIPRYDALRKEDFDKAIEFINGWYPSVLLKREIDQVNAQTDLDI